MLYLHLGSSFSPFINIILVSGHSGNGYIEWMTRNCSIKCYTRRHLDQTHPITGKWKEHAKSGLIRTSTNSRLVHCQNGGFMVLLWTITLLIKGLILVYNGSLTWGRKQKRRKVTCLPGHSTKICILHTKR